MGEPSVNSRDSRTDQEGWQCWKHWGRIDVSSLTNLLALGLRGSRSTYKVVVVICRSSLDLIRDNRLSLQKSSGMIPDNVYGCSSSGWPVCGCVTPKFRQYVRHAGAALEDISRLPGGHHLLAVPRIRNMRMASYGPVYQGRVSGGAACIVFKQVWCYDAAMSWLVGSLAWPCGRVRLLRLKSRLA